MAVTGAAPTQVDPRAQDAQATRIIVQQSVNRAQLVTAQTVFPASNPQLIVQPINVGLVKRYIIKVTGTITNSGSTTLTLTDWGLANLFATNGIQYTDLDNYLRVNTSGQHLTLLANAKRRGPMYGSYQVNQVGTVAAVNRSQMLNVAPAAWPVFVAPATIATATSGNFTAYFELPLAYSDDDLRGAIWANVLNAVQQITLQFNTAVVAVGTADTNFAVYSGPAGSAGSISSATVTIYQEYLDQLPVVQGSAGPITLLPALSLSTVYELKTTQFNNISANQEFYIPYANQRSFLSTMITYNADGTATGRNLGSDLNYLALLAANATYIWKFDPITVAAKSRDEMTIDNPAGTYYLPTRRKNIATAQFGNLQAVLNASTATANSYANVGWEAFALKNTLQSGPSLAAN